MQITENNTFFALNYLKVTDYLGKYKVRLCLVGGENKNKNDFEETMILAVAWIFLGKDAEEAYREFQFWYSVYKE